jgi:hypothetical protein
VVADQKEEKEKEKSNKKTVDEPDENMMEMLVAMGVDDIKAKYCLIQTKNKGIEAALDYMDRLSDKIDVQTELNKLTATSSGKEKAKKKKPKYIPLELQRLFSELQLINRDTVSTQDLTSKGFQWQSMEGHIQHDAHELNRLLIDALERSLKKTIGGERLCQSLYEGKVINQILCTGCKRISTREESFYDLNLQVTNCENLASALHLYCEKEALENDSAYHCDSCQKKMKAYRNTKLNTLPQILTFSCNRFRIDKSTNWQRVKITSKSEYPLLLNMNHFLDHYDLSLNAGENSVLQENDYLKFQAQESMFFYKEIYLLAEEFLKAEIQKQCSEENQLNVQHIINNLNFSNDLYDNFKDFLLGKKGSLFFQHAEDNYLLHAVIVHRGSAYSGHYFAYIRDNLQESSNIYNSEEFSLKTVLQTLFDEYFAYHEISQSASIASTTFSSSGANHPHSSMSNERNYILTNDYLYIKDENTFYISTNHLLAKVITIFRNEETQFKSKSKKKNFDKDKPFFLTPKTIMREIGSMLKESSTNNSQSSGQSYAKLYKPVFGNIEDFLKKFSLFFHDNGEDHYWAEPLNVYLLKETDYEMKVNKMKTEEKALKREAVLKENQPPQTNAWHTDSSGGKSFREAILNEHNRSHEHFDDNESVSSVGTANTSGTCGTGGAGSDWHVAGKKHKSKKAIIKEEILHSTPSAQSSNIQTENLKKQFYNSEETYKLLIKELVEILLHKTIGNFYEFNDSQVSLITYERLEKAFEGINSSYLIVYRKINDVNDFFVNNHSKQDMKFMIPQPPNEWNLKIQQRNQLIEQERLQYEDSMRNVSFFLYCEDDLQYQLPFFMFPAVENKNSNGAADNSTGRGQIITTDSNKSLKDVLASVQNQMPSKYQNVLLQQSHSSSSHHLVLSKLEKYPKGGYFPSDPLDLHKTILDQKIKTNDLLIIWCPKEHPDYFYGSKCKPVEFSLSYLSRSPNYRAIVSSSTPKNIVKELANPNIHVNNKFDTVFYLPNHFTLFNLLFHFSHKYQVAPEKIILSGVIPNFNNKTVTTAVTASKDPSTNNENNTKLVTIYRDGKFQLNSKAYYQVFINCPIEIHEDTTTIQDLWFLREFYLEVIPSTSSAISLDHSKTLAEDYHSHKSQLINVTIEIDDSVKELLKERNIFDAPNILSSSTFSLNALEDNPSANLKIMKNSTVNHLKEELLYQFGLTEVLPIEVIVDLIDFTQMRLVNPSASEDDIVENEDALISTLNLKNKTKFILEKKESWNLLNENNSNKGKGTNKESSDEEIGLVVKLINQNSKDFTYLSAEKGFEVKEITVQISKQKTVRELRDIIGVKLFGFPENWTDAEENCLNNPNFYLVSDPFEDFKQFLSASLDGTEPDQSEGSKTMFDPIVNYHGRRLRTTNWLKEFSDLLLEANKKHDAVAIKDTNLKDGDLILFEEGLLPRKGIVNLQVYLWKNSSGLPLPLPVEKTGLSELSKSEEPSLEKQFEEITALKEDQLLLIGEINFPISIELVDLYQSVHHLIKFKREKILQTIPLYEEPKDMSHILLREFLSDHCLPGKCFWLNTTSASTSGTNQPPSKKANVLTTKNTAVTPQKASNPVNSTAMKNQQSDSNNTIFRKTGLKSDSKSLIVECLSQPQSQIKSMNYNYQVWIQRLINPLSCGNVSFFLFNSLASV